MNNDKCGIMDSELADEISKAVIETFVPDPEDLSE